MTERNEAWRDGAKLQKNSGRGKELSNKGDATLDRWFVDYKEASKSFTLNAKAWAKVCTDAVRSGLGLDPVLKVIIGEGNNKIRLGIVEWDVLVELGVVDAED